MTIEMDFGKSAILEREKDVDSDVDLDLSTAHLAAANGDTEQLIKAIKLDPSILELQDADGLTPLGHAVMSQHLGAVKRLVKMGCNINAQDKLGRSGLAMAAYQGWYEGLVYLLRHGAKLQVCDRSGRSPLHAVTYNTDIRTLCALLHNLSSGEVNHRDHEGMTALHWSAFHNRPDHVRILLERGADIFREDVDGKTALHWAAQNGSLECCKLIYKWTDGTSLVNSMDHAGKTPVHFAAAAGNTHVIKEFATIEDCDLEAEDLDDRTPLHWAAATGQKECVSMFLELGVAPNPIDAEGGTPLDYAKQSNHSDCQLILEEKLGINSKSSPADQSVSLSNTATTSPSLRNPFGFIKGLLGIKSIKTTDISDDSPSDITDADMETVNMSSIEDDISTDETNATTSTRETDKLEEWDVTETAAESVGSHIKLKDSNMEIQNNTQDMKTLENSESDDFEMAGDLLRESVERCQIRQAHDESQLCKAGVGDSNSSSAGISAVGKLLTAKTGSLSVEGEQVLILQPTSETDSSEQSKTVITPRRAHSLQPLASQLSSLDIPRTPPRSQQAPPPSPRHSPRSVRECNELAPLRGAMPYTGATMHEKVTALRMERSGPSRSPTPPNWVDRSFDPLSPRQQPGLSPLATVTENHHRIQSEPAQYLSKKRSKGASLASGDKEYKICSHNSGSSQADVLDYISRQSTCTPDFIGETRTTLLSTTLSPRASPSPSVRSDTRRIGEKAVKFSTRERKELDRQLHNLLL